MEIYSPSYFEKYNSIASMMMRGCNNKIEKNVELCNQFRIMYHDTIKYILHTLPLKMSVGVKGALGKALLWYGEDKIKPFCVKIANKDFYGLDDPVYVLNAWLINKSDQRCDTRDTYRVTVTVIRSYMRNGKIQPLSARGIDRSISDIFEWEDNYRKIAGKSTSQTNSHQEVQED